MKKSTSLIICTGLFCLIVLAVSVSAGPAVEIPNPTFDFGRTLQHVKVTHDFWIKSVGDAPLRIVRVVPGCGCTEAPLLDSVLAPGDSTLLAITFSTKSFRGKITKKPYVLTNASGDKVMMTITADVMIRPSMFAPLKFSPFKVEVSQLGDQEHRHSVFLIENQGSEDLGLTIVEDGSPYFTAELPGSIKAGETVEGIVVVPVEASGFEFEKSLTFQISDKDQTRYSLPVARLIKAPDESGQ